MAQSKKITLPFPLKGINKNFAEADQPPLSSPMTLNVRPADVVKSRIRGGQRPGLKKQYATNIGGTFPVMAIAQVTIVEAS